MEHLPIPGQKPIENNTESLCNLLEAESFSRALLACYPTAVPADRVGYIGMLGTLFTNYPFEVVKKAVVPTGIPVDHPTYLPTVGEITNWLNRKRNIDAQVPLKRLPLTATAPTIKKKPGQYTYAEFLLMAEAGKVRPRPIGRFEKPGDTYNPMAREGDGNANK